MKKVCVVGHFGYGKVLLNGQTIKTKIIAKGLIDRMGESQVFTIDTHGGKKNLIKVFFQIGRAFRKCENMIMLPAHNGLLFFTPVFIFWKMIYARKCHYIVIGGWLPEVLRKRRGLLSGLRKFDTVFVETNTMKNKLFKMNLRNVYVLPNCKELDILRPEQLGKDACEPYRVCTFSRVTKQKGIEDAIEAVDRINSKNGRIVYSMDIYGQVDSEQTQWFDDVLEKMPNSIRYCGEVDPEKSVDVLKHYFALIFPTRFYTEGIPGTIIDSYSAGVPVICSKWESFHDVVDDGVVGFGYKFGDVDELCKVLEMISDEPQQIVTKRLNCINKASEYSVASVVDQLMRYL